MIWDIVIGLCDIHYKKYYYFENGSLHCSTEATEFPNDIIGHNITVEVFTLFKATLYSMQPFQG
jgi:hypothetical protein